MWTNINTLPKSFAKFIFALALSLLVILFSIKITLNFRLLYYFDIYHLNICNSINLNKSQVKSIYDYVINFMNSSGNINFNLPILPFSTECKIHFIEVRNLFLKLNFLLFILMIFCLVNLNFIKKHLCILNWCSNMLISLCIFIFLISSINFNRAFILFHEITFSNKYWLLDPYKDPIIKMLPEKYFLHCLILLVTIIICLALSLKIIHYKFKLLKK